jgi:hypothetical protein
MAPKATLLITLKDKASKGFGRITAGLKKLGSVGLGIAKVGFVALGGALAVSIRNAQVQEDAINNLNAALKTIGAFTPNVSQKFQDLAASLQKVSKFGDEAIIETQAMLISLGVLPGELEEATKATLDLAAVTGNLKNATLLMGKAAAGETGSLSRYGIVLEKNIPKADKLAATIAKINEQFGGRALAQTKTFSGQIVQLKNRFFDLSEEIGFELIPIIQKRLLPAIDKFITSAEAGGLRKWIIFIGDMAFGFKILAFRIKQIINFIKDLGVGFTKFFAITDFVFDSIKTTLDFLGRSFENFGRRIAFIFKTIAGAFTKTFLDAKLLLARIVGLVKDNEAEIEKIKRDRVKVDEDLAKEKEAIDRASANSALELAENGESDLQNLKKSFLKGDVDILKRKAELSQEGLDLIREQEKRSQDIATQDVARAARVKVKVEAEARKEAKATARIEEKEVDEAARKAEEEAVKDHFKIIAEEQAKFLAAQAQAKIDAEEAEKKRKRDTAQAVAEISQETADAIIANEGNVAKAVGEVAKRTANAEIDTKVEAEVGKAIAEAPGTFGASLFKIPLIIAAGTAAKAALGAIKFHEGGPVQRFQQGGPVDRGRLGPNEVPATLEKGEFVMKESTSASLEAMINKLNAKIDTMGQQPIILQIDGREIARATAPFNPQFSKLNKAGS